MMKKTYKKPIIEIVDCDVKCLGNNSESEITENIGAKEHIVDLEWEEFEDKNLWEEEKD